MKNCQKQVNSPLFIALHKTQIVSKQLYFVKQENSVNNANKIQLYSKAAVKRGQK